MTKGISIATSNRFHGQHVTLTRQSNFAMGLSPQRRSTCVIIDFGLTRKFKQPTGDIRPVGLHLSDLMCEGSRYRGIPWHSPLCVY
jgi:hypothetical protein